MKRVIVTVSQADIDKANSGNPEWKNRPFEAALRRLTTKFYKLNLLKGEVLYGDVVALNLSKQCVKTLTRWSNSEATPVPTKFYCLLNE